MIKPVTSVGKGPKRAMKSDPGSAAMANRTMGRPERTPTPVPDRRRSDWMSAMTGGTARMLSRRATPASQSRLPAIQTSRMALPAAAFVRRFYSKARWRRVLGGLPSPLWGGAGGGGQYWGTRFAPQQRPPSPPLPHKGGGSRPSSLRAMIPLHANYSRRAFQALERFIDLEPARLGLFALLALAFDHVLRRAGDEVGIGELGIDARDVGLDARHFLFEAGLLGGKIDHALERQRRDFPAHDELNRPLRRPLRERNIGEAREPPHGFGPARCSRLRRRRNRHQYQRNLGRWGDVHFRTHGADGANEVDDPADLGLCFEVVEPFKLRPGRERKQAVANRAAFAGHLPQLLGDERRERVQELEDLVAHPCRHRPRFILGGPVRALQHRLCQFQIPVAENVPHEAVRRARRFVELVGLDRDRK